MKYFFQQYIHLHRSIISKLNEILDEQDLSFSFWEVLFYVNRNGPSTLVEISNYYSIEKPSVTRRVHRLMDRGLIESVPTKDRREKKIQLTKLGDEVFMDCRRRITGFENEMMKVIPDHEQDLLFQILPKLQDYFDKDKG